MNDTKYVDGVVGDSKYSAVLSNNQMTITCPEDFIFRESANNDVVTRQRVFIRRLKFENKPIRIIHTVRCDVRPNLVKIDFSVLSNLNQKSFAHS